MRTLTTAQQEALTGNHYRVSARVWVENASGVLQNLSTLGGVDWVDEIQWDEDIDQPVSQVTVRLWRETGTQSLAPLVEGSPLNRANGAYTPLLEAGRELVVEVATTAVGVEALTADWERVFHGEIDEVDWGGTTPKVSLVARDLGGRLLDRFIESEEKYGHPDGAAVETVMQKILDANLGAGAVVLHSPGGTPATPFQAAESPGWKIKEFKQEKESLLEALRKLAQQVGWDVRYRWNEASGGFRLTFFEPGRANTVPDWTFSPSRYLDVSSLRTTRAGVRNVVRVVYTDEADGKRKTEERSNTASISRFGRRFMELEEESASLIDTQAEARRLADAALADLAEPKAEQEIELHFFWPGELGDLYRFSPNGVHYDAEQVLATVGVRHQLTRDQQRTTIRVRGRVAGAYREWLQREIRVAGEAVYPPGTPILAARALLTALGNASDVYVRLTSDTGEHARLHVRDGDGTVEWKLVQSGTDPTPRYVPPGTELGPDAWFHDGATFARKLGAIPLLRDQVRRVSLQGEAQNTGVRSSWIPVALSASEQPWLESVDLVWDAAAGQLRATAVAGAFCRSLKFEISDNAAFATLAVPTEGAVHPVADGGTISVTVPVAAAARNRTWYLRVQPFNAGVVNGAPTGLPGVEARDAEFTGVDTDTVTPGVTVTPVAASTNANQAAFTASALNPRNEAALGVTVTLTGCTATVDGVAFASGSLLGAGKLLLVERPAFGAAAGTVEFRARIEGGGTESIQRGISPKQRDTVYAECRAVIRNPTAGKVDVVVTSVPDTGTVQLVETYGTASPFAGPAKGTPSPSGTVWTFDRGPALGGSGQAHFRAVAAGYQSDDDLVEIPEQARDTVALAMRAEVSDITPTAVKVRVRVVDPYPRGANTVSISYTKHGIGTVTAATPLSITPTASFDSTGFVEFTVPRPAYGGGMGRVTFAATALDRIPDSDAVDVSAQDSVSFGPSLRVDPTPGPASYTMAWSGDNVTLSVDGGQYAAPPASPFTVARPASGSVPRVYSFRAQLDGQTVTNAVEVPAQATAPTAFPPDITLVRTSSARTSEGFQLTLALGANAAGGLSYRTRINTDVAGEGVWSAWTAYSAPVAFTHTRHPRFAKTFQVEATDGTRTSADEWGIAAIFGGIGDNGRVRPDEPYDGSPHTPADGIEGRRRVDSFYGADAQLQHSVYTTNPYDAAASSAGIGVRRSMEGLTHFDHTTNQGGAIARNAPLARMQPALPDMDPSTGRVGAVGGETASTVAAGSYRAVRALNGDSHLTSAVAPSALIAGRTATTVRDEARAGREGIGTFGDNLVRNGGGQEGEVASFPQGWSYGNSWTFSCQEAADARFGNRVLRIQHDSAVAASHYQRFSAGAGDVFELTGWIRVTAVGAAGGAAVLDLQVTAGRMLLLEHEAPYSDPAGIAFGLPIDGVRPWTYVRALFSVTDPCTLYLYAQLGYTTGAWATVEFDGITLRKSFTRAYEGRRRVDTLYGADAQLQHSVYTTNPYDAAASSAGIGVRRSMEGLTHFDHTTNQGGAIARNAPLPRLQPALPDMEPSYGRLATMAGRAVAQVNSDAVTGRAGVGAQSDNSVVNGGAQLDEPGALASGWSHVANGMRVTNTRAARFGDRCFVIENPTVVESYAYQDIAVKDGDVWELGAWIASSALPPEDPGQGAIVSVGYHAGTTGFELLDRRTDVVVVNGDPASFGLPADGVARDWTFCGSLVRIKGTGMLRLHPVLGFYGAQRGTAWFDGIFAKRRTKYEVDGAARTFSLLDPDGLKDTTKVAGVPSLQVRNDAQTGRRGVGSEADNLIANGGGQDGVAGWVGYGGYQAVTVDTAVARFGDRSLTFAINTAVEGLAYQDYRVADGDVVEVAAWVKTTALPGADPGQGAVLHNTIVTGVTGLDMLERDTAFVPVNHNPYGVDVGLPGDGVARDWRYIRTLFRVRGSGELRLHLILGYGGYQTGQAWFDGVTVRRHTRYQAEGRRRTDTFYGADAQLHPNVYTTNPYDGAISSAGIGVRRSMEGLTHYDHTTNQGGAIARNAPLPRLLELRDMNFSTGYVATLAGRSAAGVRDDAAYSRQAASTSPTDILWNGAGQNMDLTGWTYFGNNAQVEVSTNDPRPGAGQTNIRIWGTNVDGGLYRDIQVIGRVTVEVTAWMKTGYNTAAGGTGAMVNIDAREGSVITAIDRETLVAPPSVYDGIGVDVGMPNYNGLSWTRLRSTFVVDGEGYHWFRLHLHLGYGGPVTGEARYMVSARVLNDATRRAGYALDGNARLTDQRRINTVISANSGSLQSTKVPITYHWNGWAYEVAIAAHNLKFGFGAISYPYKMVHVSPGDTWYFYFDDPDLTGGDVPFGMTQYPTAVVTDGRYFVGSVSVPQQTGGTGDGSGGGGGTSPYKRELQEVV